MSETKVHTWDMWPSVPMCHHGAPGDTVTHAAFRCLPVEAQCPRCLGLMAACYRGRQSASPHDILSVSLFCGGLAGCLDATLAALVTGDDAARAVALDLAEERGLDRPGNWPVVERAWLRVERHEHRWLPWESGDERRSLEHRNAPLVPWIRRCTCGVFEHETARVMHHRRFACGWRTCAGPYGEDPPGDDTPDVNRVTCEACRADLRARRLLPNLDDADEPDEDPTTYAGAVGYG